MSLHTQQHPHEGQEAQRVVENASDADEEAMVNNYQEQIQYDGMEDMNRTHSYGGGLADMQAQLVSAAMPLEYQATMDTKLASYDNYCNLFHFILNSEGPVDLEAPSVSRK